MPPPANTTPLRVLCAEDETTVGEALKRALELVGCRVDWVRDGAAAYDKIVADIAGYDVLITDHQMSEFSGLGLVSKLRDTGYAGQIIVFSSTVNAAEKEVYRALAVDRIMEKPAAFKALIDVVRYIGERRNH